MTYDMPSGIVLPTQDANLAWMRHRRMVRLSILYPHLMENPRFIQRKAVAYEAFRLVMEGANV